MKEDERHKLMEELRERLIAEGIPADQARAKAHEWMQGQPLDEEEQS